MKDNGKILIFTGSTTVEGISVDVTLEVNTVDLIHTLGARAAVSSIGLCRLGSGLIKAKVSRKDVAAVKEAATLRKAKREAEQNPHGYAIIRPGKLDVSDVRGRPQPSCVGIYATRGEALAMKNMSEGDYVRGATREEYEERKNG